jgi:ribosomal protein S18 acetylase RimI-like enzyme
MITRACNYAADLPSLINLLIAHRAATDARRYPTVWRMRLLLTSRVWDAINDTRVWENESGQMIGFAMLWRRYPTSPYMALEVFTDPAHDLSSAIVEWAILRGGQIARDRGEALPLYASGSIFHAETMSRFGFTITPPDPINKDVYCIRSLTDQLPEPALPNGFAIRKLTSVDDLIAYQNMSGFAKVNPDHQKELIASDEYAHWIVVTDNGEFAAYCECSICRAEWEIDGRRIGWIDYVETRDAFKQQGLGRAILIAGLRQLQAWGAETALLATINSNAPAMKLYERMGFEMLEMEEYPAYEKRIDAS